VEERYVEDFEEEVDGEGLGPGEVSGWWGGHRCDIMADLGIGSEAWEKRGRKERRESDSWPHGENVVNGQT
jgi:hypothetical protein